MSNLDPTRLVLYAVWFLVLLLEPQAPRKQGKASAPGRKLMLTGILLLAAAEFSKLAGPSLGQGRLLLQVPINVVALVLLGWGWRLDRVSRLRSLWSDGLLLDRDVDPAPFRRVTLGLVAVTVGIAVAGSLTGDGDLVSPLGLFGVAGSISALLWWARDADRRMVWNWSNDAESQPER